MARPFGAAEEEFYQSTSENNTWESFAQAVPGPYGSRLPNRYWGRIGQWVKDPPQPFDSQSALATYCEIELQESGAFCHLSYSLDWYEGNDKGIYLGSVLEACRHAISLIAPIQDRTGQRRMWDLAFSITGVKGRIVRSPRDQFFDPVIKAQLPQDAYRRLALGVSTECLKDDLPGVVKELAGRFVAEAGLEFEKEWQSFLHPL